MRKGIFELLLLLVICGCDKINSDDSDTDSDEPFDLPDGWEDAQLTEHFVSGWMEEPPHIGADASVEIGAAERDAGLSIAIANAPFWETEYYQTFVKPKKDNVYEILIQPTDTNPDGEPLGPPGYEPWSNYRTIVAGGLVTDLVKIYRRDFYDYDEETEHYTIMPFPELLGEVGATENGDCIILEPCADDSDCISWEGSEGNPDKFPHQECFFIEACEGSFCAWNSEYEWMEENL